VDRLWPPTLIPAANRIDIIDSSGRFVSPLNGYTRTVSRPGERVRLTMSFRNITEVKRATLQAEIASMRGAANRVYVHDHSYENRGSFTAPELVTNWDMDSTTGFTVSSVWNATQVESAYRFTRNQNTGVAVGVVRVTDAVTVAQYAPYVARVLVLPGSDQSEAYRINIGSTAFASDYFALTGSSYGMVTHAFVPYETTLHYSLGQGIVTSPAGSFFSVSMMSLARCGLVDNGQNYLTTTDISNSAWTKNNVVINSSPLVAVTLPDGSSGTVNTIRETATSPASNTYNIAEEVTVTAGSKDYTFAVALKAANRTWAQIRLRDNTTTDIAWAYINLSTGALGGVSSTASSWLSPRAYVVALGNGWYYLSLTARLVSAVNTSVGVRVVVAEADGDTTFVGSAQNSIYVWNPTLAQSSVPVRLVATSGTADTDGTGQNLAGGIYTKGWPASTDGLLLPGDRVQIGSQLLLVSEPLNSDAAGKAFLHTNPAFQTAPDDNEPVIVTTAMGKFFLEPQETGWSNTHAENNLSDAEIVLGSAS
jgi:hypothetical protein